MPTDRVDAKIMNYAAKRLEADFGWQTRDGSAKRSVALELTNLPARVGMTAVEMVTDSGVA
jgi:hypothetical protein